MPPRAEPYRVVLENWAAALESGDAASLACLHIKGSVLLPLDGVPVRDPGKIRDRWEEWFAKPRFSLVLEPLSMRLYPSGDIASANAGYRLTYSGAGGRVAYTGRVLVVAVRSGHRWGIRFNAFFSDAYLRTLETFPETEFSETGPFGEMAS